MTKFSRTQKFTKENISKIPQNKAIIYKMKDGEGRPATDPDGSRGRVAGDSLPRQKMIEYHYTVN